MSGEISSPAIATGGGGGPVANPVTTAQGGLGVNNAAANGIPQFAAGVATVATLPLNSANLTGILPLASGGTGATLAATGSATQDQFLHQNGSGANVTVGPLTGTNLRDGYLDNTVYARSDEFDGPVPSANGNYFGIIPMVNFIANGGTLGNPNGISGHPGVQTLNISTTAASGCKYRQVNTFTIGQGILQADWYIMWPNGPDVTDDFTIAAGFSDNGATFTEYTAGNGAFVGVQRSVDATHFVICTVAAGVVKVNTASTTTWTAGTWYVIRVRINVNGTANFYVGTTQANIAELSNSPIAAANMPSGPIGTEISIVRVAGTTNARLINVDRQDLSNTGLTAR